MMRRLSVRRDTLHHLAVRRDSFIQRRRSSVGVGRDGDGVVAGGEGGM